MNKNLTMAMTAALMMSGSVAQAQDVNIGRNNITLTSDLMRRLDRKYLSHPSKGSSDHEVG